MAAGCRFVAGIPNHSFDRGCGAHLAAISDDRRTFIQMEDELASMAAVVGASWNGKRNR